MNVMIVFIVSGLWHGAAWTFVIWGAIHGVYQVVGTLTLGWRNALLEKLGISPDSTLIVWVRRVNTFILVTFAWLFFRANSFSDAITLIRTLFVGWCTPAVTMEHLGFGIVGALMTVLSIFVLIMIDRLLTHDDLPDGSGALCERGAFVYFVWIILFAWGLLLSKDMMSTFIYFQF